MLKRSVIVILSSNIYTVLALVVKYTSEIDLTYTRYLEIKMLTFFLKFWYIRILYIHMQILESYNLTHGAISIENP